MQTLWRRLSINSVKAFQQTSPSISISHRQHQMKVRVFQTGWWDFLIKIGVKQSFANFLLELAVTTPAKQIKLADSPKSLKSRLNKFIIASLEQETFRTTLIPYCSSLLEKIASEAYLDVWTAIAELVTAFNDSPPRIPTKTTVLPPM